MLHDRKYRFYDKEGQDTYSLYELDYSLRKHIKWTDVKVYFLCIRIAMDNKDTKIFFKN